MYFWRESGAAAAVGVRHRDQRVKVQKVASLAGRVAALRALRNPLITVEAGLPRFLIVAAIGYAGRRGWMIAMQVREVGSGAAKRQAELGHRWTGGGAGAACARCAHTGLPQHHCALGALRQFSDVFGAFVHCL